MAIGCGRGGKPYIYKTQRELDALLDRVTKTCMRSIFETPAKPLEVKPPVVKKSVDIADEIMREIDRLCEEEGLS